MLALVMSRGRGEGPRLCGRLDPQHGYTRAPPVLVCGLRSTKKGAVHRG